MYQRPGMQSERERCELYYEETNELLGVAARAVLLASAALLCVIIMADARPLSALSYIHTIKGACIKF